MATRFPTRPDEFSADAPSADITAADPFLRRNGRPWLSVLGAGIGAGLVGLLVWRMDWSGFDAVIRMVESRYLAAIGLCIVFEHGIRAWKWRRLFAPGRRPPLPRLFAAIMAGYLTNLLVPLGLSSLVRAWLVARHQRLPLSTVLASVTVDRLVDGMIFAGWVMAVVAVAAVPASARPVAGTLLGGAVAAALAIGAALYLLARHKRGALGRAATGPFPAHRLPVPLAGKLRALAACFAEGLYWPAGVGARAAIILAGILAKLMAASHFFWAGLAVDVVLPPIAYAGLFAILGFTVTLSNIARIPAGIVVGAVFALGLFGVDEASAMAMVTTVVVVNLAVIGTIGLWGLWLFGTGKSNLPRRRPGFLN